MIESLLNYEITTKILLGAHYRIYELHPLDYVYKNLNIRMSCLREN